MPTFKISEEIRRELGKFKEFLRKQEYTSATITGYHTYLSRFLRHIGLQETERLKGAVEAFLENERVNVPQTFKYCRAALGLYYKMVTGTHLRTLSETDPIPEIDGVIQCFREYSLEIKCLKNSTVDSDAATVREFLKYTFTENSQYYIDGLMADDIRKYVVERLAGLSDSTKGRMITSIRNFFRCQMFYGQQVHPSIFRLPLSPAVWKKSAFPTTIDVNIFSALHKIPDGNTATVKRNRCIILCFTALALRCSEVAALSLDDFNWHSGYVTIRSTKNGSDRVLPLPTELGNALVEYLTQARPQTACRTLFIRFSHQRGEHMGREQIRGVIRRNGAKAGLDDRDCGTHILRRTAATKLYNSGNSLKLTADILGHESLDSTTHYAKADIDGLLSVAAPWPGGERNVR